MKSEILFSLPKSLEIFSEFFKATDEPWVWVKNIKTALENIDFSKVREGIENFERPQNIKIDTKEDIDKYDDLPPDIIDTLIEFI